MSAALLALWGVGCSCGAPVDGGDAGSDAAQDDAGRADAGELSDGGLDADIGDAGGCAACQPFQYCDNGTCRDYPACAGDGSCDRPTDVCHNRRCVPGDLDIDGDGARASEDCDETNPNRFPGNPEICSGVDEDCDSNVDEGDPSALCEFYPGGGQCIEGSCGCPPGTFDLDRSLPGCECTAEPPIDQGVTCETAIDLGDLGDSGAMVTRSGNVMPDDREVWYRFRAIDEPDTSTSCDNFHVRVFFVTNPDGLFELAVFRGSCSSAECADGPFTDYRWATDFRDTIDGRLTGQCPCTPSGFANVIDQSACDDDTTEYLVRVRRQPGAALSCQSYTIEFSNGVYDWVTP